MPRLTRRTKEPTPTPQSPTDVTEEDTTPEPPSSAPGRESPVIAKGKRKRKGREDVGKNEDEESLFGKRRSSGSRIEDVENEEEEKEHVNAKNEREEVEIEEQEDYIDVTGHYSISISPFATHHTFSTADYTLTLFYRPEPLIFSLSQPRYQLWAEFSFGDLKGIMRLLPAAIYDASDHHPWTIAEYVETCALDDNVYPCTGIESWLMRWRGRDGGMRLNEKVGGEPWNAVATFNFVFGEEEDGEKENEIGEEEAGGHGGVRFSFVFAYDCKLFSFRGTKIRSLSPSNPSNPSGQGNIVEMQHRWEEMDNPAWYAQDVDDENPTRNNRGKEREMEGEDKREREREEESEREPYSTDGEPYTVPERSVTPEGGGRYGRGGGEGGYGYGYAFGMRDGVEGVMPDSSPWKE